MMDIILIATGILAFTATNIDDLFVLMLFFANPNFKNSQIVMGQYIGIFSLILISALGYFFKFIIPLPWIGILGIFPIIIGLKSLIALKNNNEEVRIIHDIGSGRSSILTVAVVSFSNGGDNIGIYTPIFATLDFYQSLVVILVFLVMIGFWCFISYHLTNYPLLENKIKRYGHIIFPFVLIGLGIYIILSKST